MKDTKQQRTISVRPSVVKMAAKMVKQGKASSFSDLVEKLIVKESQNG